MSVLNHLRNERGNLLLSGVIGALVTLLMVGVIAGSIIGFSAFQRSITAIADRTSALALLDSTFRTDVQWASRVRPTDNRAVEFTVPAAGGKCRVSVWTAVTTGPTTVVQTTVTSYPGINKTSSPVTCSGTAGTPLTQVLAADAAAGTSFGYTNASGRALKATAGVISFVDPAAPLPAGVTAKDWASLDLAAVALTTTLDASTSRATAYRFAQVADSVTLAPAGPDAPGYPVREGDLTALP